GARMLMVGALLTVSTTIGKLLAGYAPWGFEGNKRVIGLGMVPHGEIGLYFAQIAFAAGVFDRAMFSAIALVVLLTTFIGLAVLQKVLTPLPASAKAPEPAAAAPVLESRKRQKRRARR